MFRVTHPKSKHETDLSYIVFTYTVPRSSDDLWSDQKPRAERTHRLIAKRLRRAQITPFAEILSHQRRSIIAVITDIACTKQGDNAIRVVEHLCIIHLKKIAPIVDPREIGLVRSARVEAAHHLNLLPGTNVPIINALAHVIVSEGLANEDYVRERCDLDSWESWKAMILKPENSPEEVARVSGVALVMVSAKPPTSCTTGTVPYFRLYSWFRPHGSNALGMRNRSAPASIPCDKSLSKPITAATFEG